MQTFREIGSFYEANGIELLDMEESYKKNQRQGTNITDRRYYEFDIFNTVA